jgi:hypothetical protein
MTVHDQTWARGQIPERRARRVHWTCAMARHPDPTMGSPRGRGAVHRLEAARRLLAGGLAGLLAGCAPEDEPPLPPVVWEGESVRVRMDDPDIEVCGGSFDALDRHATLVRQALLLEGDGVIEYSIGDQDFVSARCDLDAPAACTSALAGSVFTTDPFNPHEIVHAVRVLDPDISIRRSSIEEGLATLFGSDDLGQGTVPLDAKGILDDTYVAGDAEYYRAGYLMALLFERHGPTRFRGFDLLARDLSEDRAFIEAFGEPMTEFAAMADEAPLCEQSHWWAPLLECAGDPMIADPETGGVSFIGNLRCGGDGVLGPRRGRMSMTRHFRLEQPVGPLGYDLEFPEDTTLEIVSCEMSCPHRFVYSGGLYDVGAVNGGLPPLEPGEYFLRLSRPVSAEDGEFSIILE